MPNRHESQSMTEQVPLPPLVTDVGEFSLVVCVMTSEGCAVIRHFSCILT